MRSRKVYSVGVVSMLVVLASVAGVAFTAGPNANSDVSSASTTDLSGVPAQSDSADSVTADMEPNDDRANATPITNTGLGRNGEFVGGTIYGAIDNASNSSDVDFFKLDLTKGQAINIYSQGSDVPSDQVDTGLFEPTVGTLYDPDGNSIASIGSGPGDVFTTGGVATETGTHYFRVNSSVDTESPNGYDFGFEIADPDSFEPNDDIDTATPIESGDRVNGTVRADDSDFFAVEADAGETITANVSLRALPTDNPANVVVDVFDSNGDRISETYPTDFDGEPSADGPYSSNGTALTGADSKDDASANATVEDAGTYYVRVNPSSSRYSDGFGSYELNVTTAGTPGIMTSTTTETPTTTQTATTTAAETTTGEATETTTTTQTATTTETATETTTEASSETAIEPLDRPNATRTQDNASITFDDQTTDGGSVTVSQVSFENGSVGGVVGIYNEEDFPIGTTLVDSGTTENISIDLDQRSRIDDDTFGPPEGDLTENTTLTARLIDLDERQFVNQDGSLVADGANVTVAEPETNDSASSTTYYQVDFVEGHQIQNLGGEKGTYTTDQLIRFAHGSTDEPITRRSDGEFTTDGTLADRIDSRNITVENDTATTTFTVSEGEPVTLTLASYTKPGAKWSRETESEQEFIDGETRTFDAGTHTLTVELPDESNESEQTGGNFSFDGFRANAEGPDEGVNLFDENFAFVNAGNESIDLSGYTVEYSSGLQYRFNDGPTVAPGERVTVVTGPGTDTVNEPNAPDDVRTYLEYGNFGEEALKNDGGTVTITDSDGEVVLNASYGNEA